MSYNEIDQKVKELIEGYTVKNGIIRDCGKFEGESAATLYFYDEYLNGGGQVMEVTEEERDYFELNPSDNWVYIHESNDGFISLEFYEGQIEAEEREYEESNYD